jgi:uncharacterized protein (TIGR00725 family)
MLKKEATLYIGVIGAGKCAKKLKDQAYAVGMAIGEAGAVLVCGGLKGVMEAAAQGAKDAGGLTVGILPGEDRAEANPYCDIVVPTGMGDARNLLVVRASDAVISLHGKYGTISEMAFSLKLGKPLISLVRWEILPEVVTIEDPFKAVQEAVKRAQHAKKHG